MVAINWLAILFLFFSIFEFVVVASPKVKTIGDSSKKESIKKLANKAKNKVVDLFVKKKILLLADSFLTHYNFALTLANVLAAYGDYEVYFVVVNYDEKELKKPLENVHLIEVLFKDFKGEYNEIKNVGKKYFEANWENKNTEFNFEEYKKLLGFYMFSFYKAIIDNPQVNIKENKKNLGIFDWLKAKVHKNFFALGITEVSVMTGGLYLFEEIGLKKYVTTTPTSPFPVHLHFLGESFIAEIPERFTAKVGDGLEENRKKEEFKTVNVENYNKITEEFFKFYQTKQLDYLLKARGENKNLIESMPTLDVLLRKSKFYFVNQHELGQFPIRSRSGKIVNIGGIEVEMEKEMEKRLLKKKKAASKSKIKENTEQPSTSKPYSYEVINFASKYPRLVVFSLGTDVKFDGFTEAHFDVLIETFKSIINCNYIVKIGENFKIKEQLLKEGKLIENNGGYFNEENGDIFFYEGVINQKELLENEKTKLFITDGGQHSFNDALYAGVPLIVLPFTHDHNYNASIAEYLKIGLSVNYEYEKFEKEFPKAFKEIMDENSLNHRLYRKNSRIILNSIDKEFEIYKGQIKAFIDFIKLVIKTNN